MTDEDKEYLISVIESQIARWCDYTGVGGDGVLATRIANALESEFAFVAYKEKQWMNDLYDAADAIERAPRWRDVADELPQEAQEVLFVRGGKTVHGAWIGGIFWHSNQKMAAAYWMPLPLPPNANVTGLAPGKDEQ